MTFNKSGSNKWLSYYNNLQKSNALNPQEKISVNYGEVIYESPTICYRRWFVAAYLNEFNVFLDEFDAPGISGRTLAASFSNKERALIFALDMYLISVGYLTRKNRQAI